MTHAPARPARVLIVGRSPSVLDEAVALLRARGHRADATNVFDRVAEDYDLAALDVLVLGGAVPPDVKQRLTDLARGAQVVQGLAGIPGVIVAQVEAVITGGHRDGARVAYVDDDRSFVVDLDRPAHVLVEAFWATSFRPPEPTSTATVVLARELDAGRHRVPLPDEVPNEAAFAAVTVDGTVQVFTVGGIPDAVRALAAGGSLPAVRAVATHEVGA